MSKEPTNNEEFMAAVFAGIADPLRPFILSFDGNPKDRKSWGGCVYQQGKTPTENVGLNWYFTLAAYRATDDGYRRQEKDCVSVFGVMLDDLGSKAQPLERLSACPPSFVIETSPGNFQATYLFDVPQTDLDRVKALNQSMVEAGLCDPGAKSPPTRYGRLPYASNGKTVPIFGCNLTEWHPERRYSIDQIIDALELAPPKESQRSKHRPLGLDRGIEDGVYTPRADQNEVIEKLKNRGLYKAPLGGGKHDVTCPWVHEHTDKTDHGTAYFEPTDLYPVGGFKCQHGHGDKYRIKALLELLGVTFHSAKHKPAIIVSAGELHRIADAAEKVLADTGRYYQRGGQIVSITTDPHSSDTKINPVPQPALVCALSSAAIWLGHDARSGNLVPKDPPARPVEALFSAEEYRHLPALSGIARQPHLRRDGSLVRKAGFDRLTGLFGNFDTRLFSIADSPSRTQAFEALGELRRLLDEIAFEASCDEAAAISAMLTAAIRPSLPTAPMFHVKAPQVASGKSYTTSLIAAFAGPASPSAVAFPWNDEECQKLLLATLLPAPNVVVFDNLTSDLLPHKSLCSALTEESITGRILGVSKTATVATRVLFLSSGNNVGPVQDMARRCVTIVLDPQVETPAARRFKGDPLGEVRAARERFVSLAITVIRAWITAGSPAMDCTPLASYEQWTKWIRQPLLWLGMPDPAERVFEQLVKDPDRELLGRFLTAWRSLFGSSPTMVREAVAKAETGYEANAKVLREVLLEVAEHRGEIDRRRLGRWISRHQGRIVDGQRFEKASSSTSAERWACKTIPTSSLDSRAP